MKELKRIGDDVYINPFGTIYKKLTEGWMVCNSIDSEDILQVVMDNPTFLESLEDILEFECLTI